MKILDNGLTQVFFNKMRLTMALDDICSNCLDIYSGIPFLYVQCFVSCLHEFFEWDAAIHFRVQMMEIDFVD